MANIEYYLSLINSLGDKNGMNYSENVKTLILDNGFGQEDIEKCREILVNTQLQYEIRFHAMYIILVYCRINRYYSRIISICQEYQSEFGCEPLFLASKGIALSFSGRNKDLKIAVKCAYKSTKHRRINTISSAILINFASIVARKYENEIKIIENPEDRKAISQALHFANRVIKRKPNNGKYYFVRGRLLSLLDRFSAAKEDISKAIDLLDPQITNYRFQLSEYYDALTRIRIRENNKYLVDQELRIKKVLNKNTKSIKDNQNKIIETLSLFAAIITLIFGGIEFSVREFQLNDYLIGITYLFICVMLTYSVIKLVNKSDNTFQILLCIACFIITFVALCSIMTGVIV